MPRQKQTPTQKELVKAARVKRLAGKSDPYASKNPRAPIPATAACKANPATSGIKKPRNHRPGVVALCEIRGFQNSIDLLILLLSFSCVVHEVAQDFRMDLYFQSSAFMAIQEAVEAYLVNLFEATNLCTIHRNQQTIVPKNFSLVKAISHISGISLWWV